MYPRSKLFVSQQGIVVYIRKSPIGKDEGRIGGRRWRIRGACIAKIRGHGGALLHSAACGWIYYLHHFLHAAPLWCHRRKLGLGPSVAQPASFSPGPRGPEMAQGWSTCRPYGSPGASQTCCRCRRSRHRRTAWVGQTGSACWTASRSSTIAAWHAGAGLAELPVCRDMPVHSMF